VSQVTAKAAKVKCGHPQCQRLISPKQFACTSHWFSLPQEMRNRMYAQARSVWAGMTKAKLDALYAIHAEAQEFWQGGQA